MISYVPNIVIVNTSGTTGDSITLDWSNVSTSIKTFSAGTNINTAVANSVPCIISSSTGNTAVCNINFGGSSANKLASGTGNVYTDLLFSLVFGYKNYLSEAYDVINATLTKKDGASAITNSPTFPATYTYTYPTKPFYTTKTHGNGSASITENKAAEG